MCNKSNKRTAKKKPEVADVLQWVHDFDRSTTLKQFKNRVLVLSNQTSAEHEAIAKNILDMAVDLGLLIQVGRKYYKVETLLQEMEDEDHEFFQLFKKCSLE